MKSQNKDERARIVKDLVRRGYSEKHIVFLTKYNQPYINKIRNGKLYNWIDEVKDIIYPEKMLTRIKTLNKILELRELKTSSIELTEQDLLYIQLLKVLLVPKERIMSLYNHVSKIKIIRYMRKKDVSLEKFNSELIGIDYGEYLDLIL